MNTIGREAAESARVVRETAEIARTSVSSFVAPDGAGPQMAQNIRNTLAGIEEVTSDLAEGTEALKRNFVFRGFFRSRGFFDLDAISREAYQAGLLERDNRTAVRIWLNAGPAVQRGRRWHRAADGRPAVAASTRRWRSWCSIRATARSSSRATRAAPTRPTAFLTSVSRGTVVRDYVLSRFRRQATLTDVMPLSDNAIGSPSGDDRWAGVALVMYVRNDVFRGPPLRRRPGTERPTGRSPPARVSRYAEPQR